MALGGGDPGRGGDSLFSTTLNTNKKVDPIIQASQIQADALTGGQALFDPFLQAGTGALPAVQQGSTVQGLDQILAEIFAGDSFKALRDERMLGLEGALGAGGLTRSGTAIEEAVNLPTELGFMIEQMLFGRNQGLADVGLSSAFSIADLMSQSAEATASGILGVEERRANESAQRSSNNSDVLGAVIGGIFSDPSLKENIRELGKIGPLTLCEWDWKPEFKGTYTDQCPTMGFLSTDVRDHFPEYVGEFGGYDIIDYKGLIKELESCH